MQTLQYPAQHNACWKDSDERYGVDYDVDGYTSLEEPFF